MMPIFYFNIALTYLVIAFGVALFYYYILRKNVPGRFTGALIVCLIGAFLGGVIEYFLGGVLGSLSNLFDSVNIFPPLIASFILVSLFSKLGK
jgi:hypothetical protein